MGQSLFGWKDCKGDRLLVQCRPTDTSAAMWGSGHVGMILEAQFWSGSEFRLQCRLESRQRWSRSISDQWLWSCRCGCPDFLHLASEKVSKIACRQL